MSGLPGSPCAESCPRMVDYRAASQVPVGQVYRLAPFSAPRKVAGSEELPEVDETKRNALKLAVVAGVIAAGGGGLVGASLQYVGKPPIVGLASYPKVQIMDLDGSPLTATKVMNE
ncbi:MAG: hypothetical protein ACYDFT_06530, partial [Thermoplasmata archaeon]